MRWHPGNIACSERYYTRVWPLDTRKHIEHRRLAGAVRADETRDLTARNINVHASDGFKPAVGLLHITGLE